MNYFDKIPSELKEIDHWVGFKIENGRKVPVDPNPTAFAKEAKINDSSTWGSFEDAARLVEHGLAIGVGFAITKDTGYIFVDFDCHTDKFDDENEKRRIRQYFSSFSLQAPLYDTYLEHSISGNGLHLLARGKLLDGYKTGLAPDGVPVEIYDDKHFMLITGDILHDWGISDSEKTITAIRQLQERYFPLATTSTGLVEHGVNVAPSESRVYDDAFVLRVAMKDEKFKLLWEGRWDEVKGQDGKGLYGSQHYADYALIKKLIFYTHNCPSQAEDLYRCSPSYMEYGTGGKWVKYEKDIRNDIRRASETCDKVYEAQAEVVDEWQPDFNEIKKQLDDGVISDTDLKNILLDYIGKYKYTRIPYIPYLFKNDWNVNGFTKIVCDVLDDQLIFSNKLQSFYLWRSKKYEMVDENALYHLITEVLDYVKHSVFMWVVTEVMTADNIDVVQVIKRTELTMRDVLEGQALSYFKKCRNMVSIKNSSDIFKKLKGMYMATDLVDYQESQFINVQNGVLDLTSMELYPHDTKYRLHKIMGCEYDPTATCPTFDAMLETLLPDEAVRREMVKAFGLCLAKEQLPAKKALFLLAGPKDTGKTTLINCINSVLGDYGTNVDNSLLMRSYSNKNNVGPELLALRDTVFISTSEVSQDARLDSAKVKAMTGNTPLSTRNLYDRQMIIFSVIGLIFIDTNHKPAIPNDEALWGRLKIFPFKQVITQKDKQLQKKLEAEKAGIFNRLLEGLRMAVEDDEIIECPAMVEAKEEYKTEMTVIEQFISDCMVMSESDTDKVITTKVYDTYLNWSKDNNFNYPMIRNKFYTEIASYIEKKKSGSEYFIRVRFSELGLLYSHMKEKTPQQFAKDKARILDKGDETMSYEMLRKNYYLRSVEWFANNVSTITTPDRLREQYTVYAEWCIRQHLMPLIPVDFNSKVGFIYENLTEYKPTPKQLEKAADVWN